MPSCAVVRRSSQMLAVPFLRRWLSTCGIVRSVTAPCISRLLRRRRSFLTRRCRPMSALSRIAGRPERGRRTPVRVGCWNSPTAGGRFTGARFSVIRWACVRNALSRVLLPMWDNRAGCCRHGTKGRRRVEEFNAEAKRWMETAKHPRWNRLYTELVYQPMLEVLSYLRNNGFKTYIVTGGGQDFVRVYAERAYGIPPEQVVGSTLDSSTTTPFAGRFHRSLGGVARGAGIWRRL